MSPAAEEQIKRLHALQVRVTFILVLASFIPLAFISAGAYVVFGRIFSQKSTDHLQTIVRDHASAVDLFLTERLMALDLIARSYSREDIARPEKLAEVFGNLNHSYTDSFLDLGVIGAQGNHLAYKGPYDLLGHNYSGATWFTHVTQEGTYISDVFTGFRNAPHFIMAVKREESGGIWVLRATIDSEAFNRVVSRGRLGRTGDCFLLDRRGRYQTPPLSGAKVMDDSGIDTLSLKGEIVTRRGRGPSGRTVVKTLLPIKDGEWVLVAQQEERELRAPFRAAMFKGMGVFALGMLIIVIASVMTTRFVFGLIEKTVVQKEELNIQLLHASKLASLGEMAAGLAHEINNPLAIIATEQTNISDLIGMMENPGADVKEMLESVNMTKKQVMRCREITQKMLQFGRRQLSSGAVIEPGPQLQEIVRLIEPQARVANVEVTLELDPSLPRIYIDPTELQQLVMNLVNNAIQAIKGGGAVVVSAWLDGRRFRMSVEDTGPGVPPEIRDKIFEPFFTTKPVGQGTGLGLSVCYGIAVKWRGKLTLENREQGGARFDLVLPPAEDLVGNN